MTVSHDPAGRLGQPELIQSSIELILANQSTTGAYPASPNYQTYRYSWLRDGAFIAHAMDRHGFGDSAARFHRWTADTVMRYQHKVKGLLNTPPQPGAPLDESRALHTRYTLSGVEVSEDWGSFQLDGYGFWLTSLAQHLSMTRDDPSPFEAAVDTVIQYLTLSWTLPCFDCWEEYPTRCHSTTWAAVAGGLKQVGIVYRRSDAAMISDTITERLRRSAEGNVLTKFVDNGLLSAPPSPHGYEAVAVAGHERVGKPLPRDGVDASTLLTLGRFGPFAADDPLVSATIEAIEKRLIVNGGVHRYLEDEFYGGGQWPVLAGAYACLPHVDALRRAETLRWIESCADEKGNLPEQNSTHLLNPAFYRPWIDRWGALAKPLLWSHAMYLLATSPPDRELA